MYDNYDFIITVCVYYHSMCLLSLYAVMINVCVLVSLYDSNVSVQCCMNL